MPEIAVKLTNLKKTYAPSRGDAPHEALKGIDLQIPRGTVYGLLGPNGAGKSTLINILAGLVLKTAGQVQIWGFDQDKNPRQSRAAIGVMPQEINFDPFLTPYQALEVQAGLYGVAPKDRRTKEILDLVGLREKAYAYSRALSGGMMRRMLLAKALAHHPAVLVLDEPTAGVDIELRQMLWKNIRKLNERGVTIILTTHYLQEAEEICDRIAIINKGDLIAEDTTARLIGKMDKKTLVVIPDTGGENDINLPKTVHFERRASDGALIFTYSRAEITAEDIFRQLGAAGIKIGDITSQDPHLEDVFLSLTAGTRTSA